MPKDTKTLGNNKAQACESLGFAHKERGCVCFDTPSDFLDAGLLYSFCDKLVSKSCHVRNMDGYVVDL